MSGNKSVEVELHKAQALRRTSTPDEKAWLERATADLRALLDEETRTFFEIGDRLIEINESRRYRAGGFDDFKAYVKRSFGKSGETARKYMRVAQFVPRSLALHIGVERAVLVAKIVEATPREETPEDVYAMRISAYRSGQRTQVTVREAEAPELRAALAAVRARGRGGKRKLPAAARVFSRRAEPRMRRLGIAVSADGRAMRFGPVPHEKLAEFFRAGLESAQPPRQGTGRQRVARRGK